jgi:hypothetical protein
MNCDNIIREDVKEGQSLKYVDRTVYNIESFYYMKQLRWTALPFVIQNVDNQLLLKAMFALAFYAFLRIGEITTKNNLNGNKVLQVSNVSFSP